MFDLADIFGIKRLIASYQMMGVGFFFLILGLIYLIVLIKYYDVILLLHFITILAMMTLLVVDTHFVLVGGSIKYSWVRLVLVAFIMLGFTVLFVFDSKQKNKKEKTNNKENNKESDA